MTTPRLTAVQRRYLEVMEGRDRLKCGWGGYRSTVTVRILEERGLCTLREWGPSDWDASITNAGREAIR